MTWEDVFHTYQVSIPGESRVADFRYVRDTAISHGFKYFAFNGQIFEVTAQSWREKLKTTTKDLRTVHVNSIWSWLMKTPCQRGYHNFQQYLTHSIPPTNHSELRGTAYNMEVYLEKMTEKVYSVRCQHCGKSPDELDE